MVAKLEKLTRETWRDLIASPTAVLMIGKSDCGACQTWTQELETYLAEHPEWEHVRFGKLELDKPGFGDFKKDNAWLADVHDLPYNLLYVNGELKKKFAGGGIDRLTNRLQRIRDEE